MNIEDQLRQHVGRTVTITNDTGHGDRPVFRLAGSLEEYPEEKEFYVRVGDDYYAGAMGLSFATTHVRLLSIREGSNELSIIIR